ncbi:MAG: hypothetical protein ACXU7H_02080 [Burkholderiaceae bacterium]
MPAARSGRAPAWWLSFDAFQMVPNQLAHNLVFKISKACAIGKMDGLDGMDKNMAADFPLGRLGKTGYCSRLVWGMGDAPQK